MSFPLIKLGDLFEIQIGKTPSRANQNYWTHGLYNWLSIADMNQGKYLDRTKEKINDLAVKESNIKLIPENTVVLSYKLSIGKVGITKKSMFTNEAIASLIPLNNNIDINFLYWALQHIDLMANTDRAAMGQTLNKAKLKEIKIPLPPLSEQKRIADILDKADELRQKRQQSIEKLDELLQATFIDMFGDPVTNPKGWGIEKLKNNISHANNGLSRRRKEVENLGEIVLRLQDIHYDGIHFNKDLNRILLDESEKKRFKVDEGDILFIRVNGNPEYVGRSAVFNGFNENIYHNDHLIRIKVNEKYNPYFLSYCLNTNSGKRIIAKQLKTSAGQHTISQGGIEMLDFIVPPIGNQNEFVRIRKNIEQQKQLLKIQLNNQENLFQSLQQRAFNGEL